MSLFITLTRKRIVLLIVAATASTAALYAAFQALAPAPAALSSFVPQGSLLSIESPNFAAVLKSWITSSEQRAWLASDNYAAFSRSRLFGRLGDAQNQFATSAGLPPNMHFLQQVAGKQSIFAWYDIGNLQFLYITRMAAGAAEQTPLLQLRSKFQLRKSGDDSFYLRTQGDPERTVAFATHGDYLLLATREDLLANALLLMQHSDPSLSSLNNESWYASVITAGATRSSGQPDLRMALNLTRIVPTPYFRSYWIQQNITDLKRYSATLSDLYLSKQDFREERILLPKAADNIAPTADLAPILQFAPLGTGVYRASAHPTTDQALDALNDKLLASNASSFRDQRFAPVIDLNVQDVGSINDLETRIDTPPIPQQPVATSLAPLRALFDATPLDALLVYSSTASTRANEGPAGNLFLPVHTAVVLSSPTPFAPSTIQSALSQALSARLTVSTASLNWQTHQRGSVAYFELAGLEPLAFAIHGNFCILASDPEALLEILNVFHPNHPEALIATAAAGFNHTAERPGFSRLTSLLDRTDQSAQSSDGPPAFFSRNVGSLSRTFESLDSETFTETVLSKPDIAPIVTQKVVYKWRP